MTTSDAPDFILASASPRRRELLEQIGARFVLAPTDIDESVLPGESPRAYVARMAEEKAKAGWSAAGGVLPVMGADTSVVQGDKIFGKPADKRDALAMLAALSGVNHQVISAVCITNTERSATNVSETQVTFRDLSIEECERYWMTGEPADKAGAYGIQGAGAVFVSRIEGSYSGVVGLPIAETTALMQQFDLPWWQVL